MGYYFHTAHVCTVKRKSKFPSNDNPKAIINAAILSGEISTFNKDEKYKVEIIVNNKVNMAIKPNKR